MRETAEEVGVRGGIAGRRDRAIVPLDESHGVGERSVFLRGGRHRQEEHLGLDVLGGRARRLPKLGRLREEDVGDDHPLELGHGVARELGVGAADCRILPVGEEALDLAVVHVHEHVLMAIGVGGCAFRQPLVAELVVLCGRVAVEGLQQAHHELRLVRPEAALRRLLLEVRREIRVGVAQRLGHVARQLVVEQLEVRGALDVRVAPERDDAAARPADVAEQELEHAERADVLHAVGMLGQVERVRDRPRLLGAGVAAVELGDLLELRLRDPAHALHHLGRVPAVVALEELEDGVRV